MWVNTCFFWRETNSRQASFTNTEEELSKREEYPLEFALGVWSLEALYKLQNSLNSTVGSLLKAKEELMIQIQDVSFRQRSSFRQAWNWSSSMKTELSLSRAPGSVVRHWRECARSTWVISRTTWCSWPLWMRNSSEGSSTTHATRMLWVIISVLKKVGQFADLSISRVPLFWQWEIVVKLSNRTKS